MKKRMLNVMPTLMVLAVFLFSGLTVQAQVFTGENGGVATITVNQLGKSTIQYMDASDAISAIRLEVGTSYPVPVADDNNPSNAAQVYGRMLYETAGRYIGDTENVQDSVHKAWVEVKTLANAKYNNLITQDDYDNMVALLSL